MSLKRYAKAMRLQNEMEERPPQRVALENTVDRNFARMITARAQGLPLPVAVPTRLVVPLLLTMLPQLKVKVSF